MLPPGSTDAADAPLEGVRVYGMHLEGCAWDASSQELTESQPKVLTAEAPAVWLRPVPVDAVSSFPHYSCPVYRTAERKGACHVGLTSCVVMCVHCHGDGHMWPRPVQPLPTAAIQEFVHAV